MTVTLDEEIKFKQQKDGILEYCGSTELPDVIESWDRLDLSIDVDIWSQASIAAAIVPKWKKETVKDFADHVEKSFGYIYKIANTYRYFTTIVPRVQKLTFKHHTLSLRHPNPHAALLYAKEKGFSCVRFEEWILNEMVRGGGPRAKAALMKIKENDLRVFLEHVDDVIVDDFIANCPNKDYASRRFGELLREIREDVKQLYIDDLRDTVRAAIESRGAYTVKEIARTTGIKQHEVESAVSWLVDSEEEYEWIPKRGETDDSRGTHEWILHRTGEPHGGGYSAPRTSNNYSN